ncbi:hypothetical protein CORC01_04049 [Colletotrichum orchidophilum]|uniref:Cyclin-like F-box n=1 Tax=Colletotrichum orchidophilum TaxID=1209926 RepID=A0A1G4BH11_9PEZI|nr:uncharacterized protein CORC01_04049 [Colletotrichum orchidophilum]OHF00732.1 hypothetical protein CORC01_04049 [Colletotrichum orchidophilum]
MSPNAPEKSTTPAEVAFANDAESFVPKPLINDLLRTRYCIPGSIFLVEDVESLPVPRSKRWRTMRLMLGDGELCIQALLRGEMHRFLDTGGIRVGCYVRLGEFAIRLQDLVGDGDRSGGTRQMVCLIVRDLVTVGWHRALTEPDAIPQAPPEQETEDDIVSDSDVEPVASPTKAREPRPIPIPTSTQRPRMGRARSTGATAEIDDEDEEGFEVMKVSETKATQRRVQAKNKGGLVALPRDWTDPNMPLKLTSLRSIPNLPYKQNWSVNVLAVVASLSEVEPSHMPPHHTQRTARLVDPSTSKQVILTVFLDAEAFTPKVGSVVLLVGVKNHRFDGGCLKKYVSDKPNPGNRWWFEEPQQFDWCDVDALKQWWEQSGLQGMALDGA